MHARRCFGFAVLLFLLGASAGRGDDVLYPKEAPQFSITVPQHWRAAFRPEHLMILPEPEDGFLVQVDQQPAAAEDRLKDLAKRVAKELKIEDLEIGDDSEAENQHDVDCTMLTSRGNLAGTPVVMTLVAFSIGEDQHFTVQSIGATALNQKHSAALLAMIDSIKPIAPAPAE